MPKVQRKSSVEFDEGSGNVWLHPYDTAGHQRTCLLKAWDSLQLVVSIIAAVAGIYACGFTDLRVRDKVSFWFIISTLSAETVAMALAGCAVLALELVAGDVGLAHSIALISVSHQASLAVIYYMAMFTGIYIAVTGTFTEPIYADPVIVYISCAVLLCLSFSLSTCNFAVGAVGFAWANISHRFRSVPIVQFFNSQHALTPQYVELTPVPEYLDFMANLGNPVETKFTSGGSWPSRELPLG